KQLCMENEATAATVPVQSALTSDCSRDKSSSSSSTSSIINSGITMPLVHALADKQSDVDLLGKEERCMQWSYAERLRWMWCLFAGQAALFIARTVTPVCAVSISMELSWNKKETGAALGVFFWGYMATQFLGGYLADTKGGERVVVAAAYGWAGVTLFIPFLPALTENHRTLLTAILAARVVQGACQGFHNPAVGSLMSHRVGLKDRGTTFAFQAAGAHVGTLLCGSLGSIILDLYGWRIPFILSGCLTLVWALATRQLMLIDLPSSEKQKSPQKLHHHHLHHPPSSPSSSAKAPAAAIAAMRDVPWSRLFRAPPFWAMLVGHYAHGHAYYILLSWLPTYFHDTFPTARSWVFNLVPWLVTVPSALMSGLTADALIRRGISVTATRKIIVSVTLLGCAFFLLLMPYCSGYVASLSCMAAAVAFSGFHNSGVQLNPTDLAPDCGGAVFGIMNMAGALPGFLGVYLVGFLLEWTKSWSAVFQQTAVVCIVGWLVYLLFGSGRRII
ncbi:hypothetical protein BOX15_Mlig023703g2, partial [Macrostomum lignano]